MTVTGVPPGSTLELDARIRTQLLKRGSQPHILPYLSQKKLPFFLPFFIVVPSL